LKLASVEFDRAKQLRDRNVTSAGDFDQKSAAFLGAQAAVQTAMAAVSSAQLNVEFCSIISPIEGRASLANITVGNLVSPETQTPLTTVKSINPIYAYADVDERSLLRYTRYYMGKDATAEDIDKVKVPIELALQDEEGFPHKGYIDFLDNAVDPSTGTIRLRGIFENSGLLGPGLFVRVRIPSGDPHQAVLVPERSVGTDQGQKFVYIVDKDNVVVYRPVDLGRVHDGLQVITKGVAAGETVIVDGLLKARPGTKVTPKELPPENAETHSEAQPQNGGDAK
jgi:RND family efflux transporter MFP subunit